MNEKPKKNWMHSALFSRSRTARHWRLAYLVAVAAAIALWAAMKRAN